MRHRSIGLAVLLVLLVGSLSFASTPVTFRYEDPGAKAIFIAGTFNNWNATQDPLAHVGDGVWEITIDLEEGSYQYKFVVDGLWYHDSTASEFTDDGFGGKNSLIRVESKGAVESGLRFSGYVKSELAANLIRDAVTDTFPDPTLYGEVWLKLSGNMTARLNTFTEIGIKRNTIPLNKDIQFADFPQDEIFINQSRITYVGDFVDVSYYYKGRSGSSQDFLQLWFDEDADGKDKIGWNRSGLGLAGEWNNVSGRVIGLKRPNDQLLYGEAVWEQDGMGVGAGFTHLSKPDDRFASGRYSRLNGTIWGWYPLTDQIRIDGQVLISLGGTIEYEEVALVPFTLVMTEEGAGDGQIGQAGTYEDIAYVQLRGAFNGWNWETSGGGWDSYQEGYAYDMVKQPDGSWIFDLELEPGDYEFKIRLFDKDKKPLGDVWGSHNGNAMFTVVPDTQAEEVQVSGLAYLLRGIFKEEVYGTTVALQASQPDVENEVGGVGVDYLNITTDSWFEAVPDLKLTFFTKNSYNYSRELKNEILLKPGVEYAPPVEYIESLKAWFEYFFYPEEKAHKFTLQAKAKYHNLGLESTFSMNTDKEWQLKNKLEGTISDLDFGVKLETENKKDFWLYKGEVNRDIVKDVNLKLKAEVKNDKSIGGGAEVAWRFPNKLSDDVSLYLHYWNKSEIKEDVRTISEHKVILGVKGDF